MFEKREQSEKYFSQPLFTFALAFPRANFSVFYIVVGHIIMNHDRLRAEFCKQFISYYVDLS